MKKLQNKQTEIAIVNERGENVGSLAYADLLKSCINVMPQGGMNVDEMQKRLRLTEAIKNAKKEKSAKVETISLEDADADNLKKLVGAMSWTIMHQDIIDFVAYVKGL